MAWEMRDREQQTVRTDQKVRIEEKNRYKNITRLMNTNRIDEDVLDEASKKERDVREGECRRDERLAQELVRTRDGEVCRAKKRSE